MSSSYRVQYTTIHGAKDQWIDDPLLFATKDEAVHWGRELWESDSISGEDAIMSDYCVAEMDAEPTHRLSQWGCPFAQSDDGQWRSIYNPEYVWDADCDRVPWDDDDDDCCHFKPPVLSDEHPCDFCQGRAGKIEWCAVVFEKPEVVIQAMLHQTSECIDGFIKRAREQFDAQVP